MSGDFSSWMVQITTALRGDGDSDVPCGGCTACCTSSQFVTIEPDEVDTLAHIPAVLLFPAPRRPPGHVVLGYDERGHCPMLADGGCSIYEHRPRACRAYDCRVFTAAGVVPDKPAIAERVVRWRFDHPTAADRAGHDAVRAAARFLDAHPEVAPAPLDATRRAVLALEIHALFVGSADPEPDAVRRAAASAAPA